MDYKYPMFEVWSASKKKESRIEALKKEYNNRDKYPIYQEVLTYDDLVYQAIESGENEFEYHNHYYMVQENEVGGYDVISNEEKVADVVIENDERVVLIDDRKKEYIRNTKSAYYENLYKEELTKVRKKPYFEMPKKEKEK